MRTAVNGTVWGALGKALGTKYGWKDIVRQAAEAGFEGIETGGTEERMGPADETLAFFEANNMQIAAWFASVTYNPYPPNTKSYKDSMRYAKKLGVKIVSVCGGFIPNQRRNTYPFDYDMFAGNLGKAMEYADKLGLEIAYHPHRGCVVETIAETREMIKRLPDLKLCIDTAHLEACNEDVMKFIKTFQKRIIGTHIKDYSWKKDSFVEPGKGDGRLDVAKAVKALEKGGYKGWYTIELDKAWDKFPTKPEPLKVAKQCRRFLKSCGF